VTVRVVIPARNEGTRIGELVRAVRAQETDALVRVDVVVVDDGSSDDTADAAARAGARVVRRAVTGAGGNPAAARNLGARAQDETAGTEGERADPIVFLDADCTPAPGWLRALLDAHARGAVVVGGAIELAPGLPLTARCDYYATSYLQHAGRPAGDVVSWSPANLSVRRDAFLSTDGFTERHPVADGHEELAWQGALRRAGARMRFEPRARVYHRNRAGVGHLMRRSFRWGYSTIEAKAGSGAARAAALYRRPRLVVALALPLGAVQTVHALGCWLRARRPEALLFAPGIFAARMSYAAGMMLGGTRWLRRAGAQRAVAVRTGVRRADIHRADATGAGTPVEDRPPWR
jgi:GT2 family glycosyltransferase